MAIFTTKTYDFNPSAATILLNAYARLQIRPTELTEQHLFLGQQVENLVLVEMSNLQPNLWEVGVKSIPLQAGTATYSLPAETVMVLDVYISQGSPNVDRYINALSRTEYAAIPNKSQQGFPNQYWFDRLISPSITFYFVPDTNGPYIARYYAVRQTQDAQVLGDDTIEIPYRWLEAFTAGVAWKLSEIYRPEVEDKLFMRYQRALQIAMTQDTENVALMITPGMTGYWR